MDISVLREHSQTFVGVIASLLLITIIWSHESNFVMRIVDERSEAIKDIWRKLNNSIRERSRKWRLLNKSAYKKFQAMEKVYILGNGFGQKIQMDERGKERFLLLDERLETWRELLITEYSRNILPMINRKIDAIKVSKKIVVSAIFALMSCLLVFVADEAMAIFPMIKDYIVSFLCLFLVIGSAYALGMWGSFFFRYLPWVDDEKLKNNKFNSIKQLDSIKIIGWLTGIAVLSCLLGVIISSPKLLKFIVFGVGMIVPVMCVGGLKILCRDYTENHPYSFAINHFIEFCVLAGIWTSLLFMCSCVLPNLSNVFFVYTDWNPLLVFLEIYLIFIGIIFPIFLPYLNTYILQWYMKSRLYEPKNLIKKDPNWNDLNQETINLYKYLSQLDKQET